MIIYRYPIKITDTQTVLMPINAKILCVQIQRDELFLWAQVEPFNTDKNARTIDIFGTGCLVDDQRPRIYIGTFQAGYALVRHVFERLNPMNITASDAVHRTEPVKPSLEDEMYRHDPNLCDFEAFEALQSKIERLKLENAELRCRLSASEQLKGKSWP